MESPARDEAKDRSRDEDEIELERTWSEQICSITKREREGGGEEGGMNSPTAAFAYVPAWWLVWLTRSRGGIHS